MDGSVSVSASAIADMDAADTFTVTVYVDNGSGQVADIYGAAAPYTYVSVQLLA